MLLTWFWLFKAAAKCPQPGIFILNIFAGAQLAVAIAEHVPMVQLNRSTNTYQGVEVEIMNALAKALNFQPLYYAINESDVSDWEQSLQGNETRMERGLVGEVVSFWLYMMPE